MTESTNPRPRDLLTGLNIEVPSGTSLLVAAPEPMGSDVLIRLLAEEVSTGGDVLTITTDDSAGTILDRIGAGVDASLAPSEHVHVIDCQTGDIETDAGIVVQNVDTPRNLTDIGIGFTNAFDDFEAAGIDHVRFGLFSLSVVLSYVDQETVYRFCQTLTRGLAQENAVGLFLLNVGAHDQETIGTLERAFDGTLEVERRDGDVVVRLTGLDGVDPTWRTLPDE